MFWKISESNFAARRRLLASGGLILATSLLSGCLTMEIPARFLSDEDSAEGLKAVSPDEAKLWVREFNDPDQGGLDFWAEALKNDLVGHRGYTLIEENDVTDREGRKGVEFVFEMSIQGIPHRYAVTLFVLEGWWWNTIRVSEFAAEKKIFDGYLAGVRESNRTISRTLFP